MTLIDKRKRDTFITQYEQLLKAIQERAKSDDPAGMQDFETIVAGKEELERVFAQYQLQYNELQYLVARYETLHKNMRIQLRNVRIRVGLQSHK